MNLNTILLVLILLGMVYHFVSQYKRNKKTKANQEYQRNRERELDRKREKIEQERDIKINECRLFTQALMQERILKEVTKIYDDKIDEDLRRIERLMNSKDITPNEKDLIPRKQWVTSKDIYQKYSYLTPYEINCILEKLEKRKLIKRLGKKWVIYPRYIPISSI